MRRSLLVPVVATSLGLFAGTVSGPAFAADTPTPPPTPTLATPAPANGPATTSAATTVPKARTDHMAAGRAAKDRADWKAAIIEFQAAVDEDSGDADAHNLLAYSYRKSGNLAKAFEHYDIALRLNPKHRGAHEYRGEAFVQSGDLVKAKAELSELDKICGKSCEEYRDLADVITKAETSAAPAAAVTATTVARNPTAAPTKAAKKAVRTKKAKKK